MQKEYFVITDSKKKASVPQWPQDFIGDITLRSSVLLLDAAERRFWIAKNISVESSSGRASVHSYRIGSFGLRLANNTNSEYTIAVPQEILMAETAIRSHASSPNSWVVATWENPKFALLSEYCTQMWVKLKEITRLPTNWDSFGAVPISVRTAARTLEVLIGAFEVSHSQGWEQLIPFVVPCPDGSIQLEWERNGKELEVVIPPSRDEKITLLQVSGEEKELRESTIDLPEEIDQYLSWLLKE